MWKKGDHVYYGVTFLVLLRSACETHGERVYYFAIALCVENGVAIEINEAYGVPHRAFLVRAHIRGARFAVGSDTHFDLLDLDKTDAMIHAAGIDPDERGRFLDGSRSPQDGVSRATSS